MLDETVQVMLNIPKRKWGRLATIASEKNTVIADLLTKAIDEIIDGSSMTGEHRRQQAPTPALVSRVLDLVNNQNVTVRDVSERLGLSRRRVYEMLHSNGWEPLRGSKATAAARSGR